MASVSHSGELPGVDVLIPAYNEAANVARVVAVALAAKANRVLVVDDGSSDDTTEVARNAGAEVLTLAANRGKGGALHAGASACTSPVIVLLDADLLGLLPDHVHQLALPVVADEADMSRGTFTGGRFATTAAQTLTPQLNGQRAIRRELLLGVPSLVTSRYGVEIAITRHAAAEGWRCVTVKLPGVSQVMKEEKMGFWRGVWVRLGMYRDIIVTALSKKE